MENLYDVFDFYPKGWSENQKSRVAIWVILIAMLTGIAVLCYQSLYKLPNKINEITIVNDSLRVDIKAMMDERKQAMIEWRKGKTEDSLRRIDWDKKHKFKLK